MAVADIKELIDEQLNDEKKCSILGYRNAFRKIKSMLDQLDSDWVTDRPPKKSGKYLIINGEKKYDVRKYDDGWYHDMYRRYSDEELKVIAWKKIEPYERKESEDGQGTTNED